jgi:hypothetical protein
MVNSLSNKRLDAIQRDVIVVALPAKKEPTGQMAPPTDKKKHKDADEAAAALSQASRDYLIQTYGPNSPYQSEIDKRYPRRSARIAKQPSSAAQPAQPLAPKNAGRRNNL